jgi:hypothetical protein
MDQTVVYATETFLRDELAKATLRIGELEESHVNLARRSYVDSIDKDRLVEGMQDWTLEALKNAQITESEAEEISEIMGFDLTKEFGLEVTVVYSITVNATDEESAQNLIDDIDFDTVSYGQEVTYLSSIVDRVDI